MKLKGQGRWGNVKGCRQAPSVYFQGYGEAQGFCGEVRALVLLTLLIYMMLDVKYI